RIIPIPAVADGYVQKTIATESEHSSVVFRIRMRNGQNNIFMCVGDIWICGRYVIFRNDDRSVRLACVIHKEPTVLGKVRMERKTEQASLGGRHNQLSQIQKNAGRRRLRPDD